MENTENIFQRQVIEAKYKPRAGKTPTRLQKQAPTSLQFHQITNTVKSFVTPTAPLVISPPSLSEAAGVAFPTNGDSLTIGGGWQHPAVAGYMEPSAIFAFFQSQFVLVDQAR